jgi:hypothetical protein
MAVAYRTSAVGGNTTTGTSPTATIIPVVGDLFVVFCQATGNTNAAPTCTDDNSSGTYTLISAQGSNTNGNFLSCFVRTALLGSTASTTVTVATGAHSAAEVCVIALSGASVAGAAAIVQSAVQANKAASTTPAPTFGSSVLVQDVVLSAVGNATNPAGVSVTENTSTWTWTRAQNTGQTGCGLGIEYSGNAINALPGNAVTWGSTSASVYASIAVEVAAAAPHTGIDVSKLISYGAVAPPIGADVSKLVAYGALAPPIGVAVSKLVAYAVLTAVNTNPPVWPSLSPPPGYVGNTYGFSWDLTSAASPTTYTLFSGSLPPGLSLSNVAGGDGNQGQITGIPTTVGGYSFVVTATNAYGSSNEPMTINIYNPTGIGGSFVYIG